MAMIYATEHSRTNRQEPSEVFLGCGWSFLMTRKKGPFQLQVVINSKKLSTVAREQNKSSGHRITTRQTFFEKEIQKEKGLLHQQGSVQSSVVGPGCPPGVLEPTALHPWSTEEMGRSRPNRAA